MKNFPQDELVFRIREKMRRPLMNGEAEILFSKEDEYCGVRGAAFSAFEKIREKQEEQ